MGTDGTPLTLNFTKAARSSKLFSDMPQRLMEALATKNLTENSHRSGVTQDTFEQNKKLSSFFSLLSTSRLGDGKTFVSTIEGKRYPFTGTQWHPEKANFDGQSLEDLVTKRFLTVLRQLRCHSILPIIWSHEDDRVLIASQHTQLWSRPSLTTLSK